MVLLAGVFSVLVVPVVNFCEKGTLKACSVSGLGFTCVLGIKTFSIEIVSVLDDEYPSPFTLLLLFGVVLSFVLVQSSFLAELKSRFSIVIYKKFEVAQGYYCGVLLISFGYSRLVIGETNNTVPFAIILLVSLTQGVLIHIKEQPEREKAKVSFEEMIEEVKQ